MKRSTRILLILLLIAIFALVAALIATQPSIDATNQLAKDFFTGRTP